MGRCPSSAISVLPEERDPASQHLCGREAPGTGATAGQRERAQGRRRGILLKGKVARSPRPKRLARLARGRGGAGRPRAAGGEIPGPAAAAPRPRASLRLSGARERGLRVGVGRSARGNRQGQFSLLASTAKLYGTWHPSALPIPHSGFSSRPLPRPPRETDGRAGQWQDAKRQLCVRPPLSASGRLFLPSPAFRVGRPLLATHGWTLSAAILCVANVASRNPFTATPDFLLSEHTY